LELLENRGRVAAFGCDTIIIRNFTILSCYQNHHNFWSAILDDEVFSMNKIIAGSIFILSTTDGLR